LAVAHAERVQDIGRMFQGRPVGLTAHDQGHGGGVGLVLHRLPRASPLGSTAAGRVAAATAMGRTNLGGLRRARKGARRRGRRRPRTLRGRPRCAMKEGLDASTPGRFRGGAVGPGR